MLIYKDSPQGDHSFEADLWDGFFTGELGNNRRSSHEYVGGAIRERPSDKGFDGRR
jgi:hypothetical protein